VCVRCSTPVPAEGDEIAWVCAQCGQGLALDENTGLAALEVNYSAQIPTEASGKPYWVSDGSVRILGRETYGSGSKGETQAGDFWGQERRFFVPAYEASLENLLSDATRLLRSPPNLVSGPPVGFEAVTRAIEDVRSAAEFIIVAIEAGRVDKLKTIRFELELSDPVLWVLP
jgi:hypothetical protein